MKKVVKIILSVVFMSNTFAQQDVDVNYSNFMYNMGEINPGYMYGDPDLFQLGVINRNQWVGINGAPHAVTAFGSVPIGETFEIKGTLHRDTPGATLEEYTGNLNFSKAIKLRENMRFALGIKTGFEFVTRNFTNAKVTVGTDTSVGNILRLSVGGGAYLYGDNYFLGLSIPTMVSRSSQDGISIYDRVNNYLTAGYVFKLPFGIQYKPSVLLNYTLGNTPSFSVANNFLIDEIVEVGMMYRHEDAITGLASFNIYKKFKLGYAYDYGLSELSQLSSGSHEVILIFTFDLLNGKKKYSSPRFF